MLHLVRLKIHTPLSHAEVLGFLAGSSDLQAPRRLREYGKDGWQTALGRMLSTQANGRTRFDPFCVPAAFVVAIRERIACGGLLYDDADKARALLDQHICVHVLVVRRCFTALLSKFKCEQVAPSVIVAPQV